MPGIKLKDHQEDALNRMRNGCILNGGTGSGKSRTALAYYYVQQGGEVNTPEYISMKPFPKDLYIITTAKKRDALEWESELTNFIMTPNREISRYRHNIVIDSWNNIKKYCSVKNSFFIFDEQRVIGYGSWTKAFLTITVKNENEWILLTATPGDTWLDYIPVFIANGFYKNKTDFLSKHAIFSRFTKYPKIERYINEGRLIRLREYILIDMDFERKTVPHHEYVAVDYDRHLYEYVARTRWNIYKDAPIVNAGEFCFTLRRIVNSDTTRLIKIVKILKDHPKAIIFYSYDYELLLLRSLFNKMGVFISEWNEKSKIPPPENSGEWVCLIEDPYPMSEWNGHKHEEIIDGDYWAYVVEYLAGCEGWNCIETDTIIFYSENYSYRIMQQASGRIDRLNTPFIDLYYFHFRSNSKIDLAIRDALRRKKKFNERKFAPTFDAENKEKGEKQQNGNVGE